MKMKKTKNKRFVTAVTIPTIIALCATVTPAMAQSNTADEQIDRAKTSLTVTLRGLDNGTNVNVKDLSNVQLGNMRSEDGKSSLSFSKSDGIKISAGKNYEPLAAKCVGVKLPEGYFEALEKAKKANEKYEQEQQGADLENAYNSISQQNEAANDRSDLLNPEGKGVDQSPAPKPAPDSASNPSPSAGVNPVTPTPSPEANKEPITDGSNTPVADPKSLDIPVSARTLNAEIKDESEFDKYVDETVSTYVDNILSDVEKTSDHRARPLANKEVSQEEFKKAAEDAEKIKKKVFHGETPKKDDPLVQFLNFFIENEGILKLVGSLVKGASGFSPMILQAAKGIPQVNAIINQFHVSDKQVIDALNILGDVFENSSQASLTFELIVSPEEAMKNIAKKHGFKLDVEEGGFLKKPGKGGYDLGTGEGDKGDNANPDTTPAGDNATPGNEAGIDKGSLPNIRPQINEATISASVANNIKENADRVPLDMSADSKEFTVNGTKEYNFIECALDFDKTENDSKDKDKSTDSDKDKDKKKDKKDEKTSSDKSAKDSKSASKSDDDGVKVEVVGAHGAKILARSGDKDENSVAKNSPTSSSSSVSSSSSKPATSTSSTTATPVKVGPKVDTGGQVDNSLATRLLDILGR